MSELYQLETPEAVRLDYDIAGIGTRFLAASIDAVAIAGIFIIMMIGVVAVAGLGAWGSTLATVLFLVLSFCLLWGYYILYEAFWSGQTPGKRALHIRVLKINGYPVGLVEVVIRNIVRVIDFLPALYALGAVVMFIQPQSRRLGDLAASTIVVKERSPLIDLPTPDRGDTSTATRIQRGAVDSDELSWNLDALDTRDLAVVQEFLDRAPTLSTAAVQRIGERVASHVAQRIDARAPFDTRRFLERVAELHAEDPE